MSRAELMAVRPRQLTEAPGARMSAVLHPPKRGATGEGEASVEGAFGTDRADTGGVWERGVSTDAFFANLQGDDFQGDIAGPEVGMGAGGNR